MGFRDFDPFSDISDDEIFAELKTRRENSGAPMVEFRNPEVQDPLSDVPDAEIKAELGRRFTEAVDLPRKSFEQMQSMTGPSDQEAGLAALANQPGLKSMPLGVDSPAFGEAEDRFRQEEVGRLIKDRMMMPQRALGLMELANRPDSGQSEKERLDDLIKMGQAQLLDEQVAKAKPKEDTWSQVVGKSIVNAPGEMVKGLGGIARAYEETLGQQTPLGQWMGRNKAAEGIKEFGEGIVDDVNAKPGTLKSYFGQATSSIAQNMPWMLVGAFTGGPAVPLVAMGAQGFGQKYEELRDKNIDPANALGGSMIEGGAEVVGEVAPLNILLKRGLPIMKRFVKSILPEITGEELTYVIQAMNDRDLINHGMTWQEFGRGMIDTAIVTGIATPIQAGMMHGAVKLAERNTDNMKISKAEAEVLRAFAQKEAIARTLPPKIGFPQERGPIPVNRDILYPNAPTVRHGGPGTVETIPPAPAPQTFPVNRDVPYPAGMVPQIRGIGGPGTVETQYPPAKPLLDSFQEHVVTAGINNPRFEELKSLILRHPEVDQDTYNRVFLEAIGRRNPTLPDMPMGEMVPAGSGDQVVPEGVAEVTPATSKIDELLDLPWKSDDIDLDGVTDEDVNKQFRRLAAEKGVDVPEDNEDFNNFLYKGLDDFFEARGGEDLYTEGKTFREVLGDFMTYVASKQDVAEVTPAPRKVKKPTEDELADILIKNGLMSEGHRGKTQYAYSFRKALPLNKWLTNTEIKDRVYGAGKDGSGFAAKDIPKWAELGILDKLYRKDGRPVYAWAGTSPEAGLYTEKEIEGVYQDDIFTKVSDAIEKMPSGQLEEYEQQMVDGSTSEVIVPQGKRIGFENALYSEAGRHTGALGGAVSGEDADIIGQGVFRIERPYGTVVYEEATGRLSLEPVEPTSNMATERMTKNVKFGADTTLLLQTISKDIVNNDLPGTVANETIQNSLDAVVGNKGDKTIEITVRKDSVDYTDETVVIIEDNGKGMTPNEVEKNLLRLGAKGKEGTTSRGGYGLAKAGFILTARNVTITTTKNGTTTVLTGTREQFFGLKDAGKPSLTVTKDSGLPNGTKFELHFYAYEWEAKEHNAYNLDYNKALESFENYIKNGVRVPGINFVLKKTLGLEERSTTQAPREMKQLYPPHKLEVEGNKITVYYVPKTEKSNRDWTGKYHPNVYTYNKGLALFGIKKSEYGLTGMSEEPAFSALVDFERTPDVRDLNYPFIRNRTELNYEVRNAVRDKVNEVIKSINDADYAVRTEDFQRMVERSPVVEGVKVLIPFKDDAEFNKAVELIEQYPETVKDLAKIFKSFQALLDKGIPGKTIELTMTVDPKVHGFRSNPEVVGVELYAINPFAITDALELSPYFQSLVLPDSGDRILAMASNLTHTLVHEYTHNKHRGHGEDFALGLAKVYMQLSHGQLARLENQARSFYEKHEPDLRKLQNNFATMGQGGSELAENGAALRYYPGVERSGDRGRVPAVEGLRTGRTGETKAGVNKKGSLNVTAGAQDSRASSGVSSPATGVNTKVAPAEKDVNRKEYGSEKIKSVPLKQAVKKGLMSTDEARVIDGILSEFPEAWQKHLRVEVSDQKFAPTDEQRKKAGMPSGEPLAIRSTLTAEKIGPLKEDTLHIITMFRNGNSVDFIHEVGEFVYERVLSPEDKAKVKKAFHEDPNHTKGMFRNEWFGDQWEKWWLKKQPIKDKGLVGLFRKGLRALKNVYDVLRSKGGAVHPEMANLMDDIITNGRDIKEKYYYSDKEIVMNYVLGVEPDAKTYNAQGFSGNSKTLMSWDPSSQCPKQESFINFILGQIKEGGLSIEDLANVDVISGFYDAALAANIPVPCSYCYVEQARRKAIAYHQGGGKMSLVNFSMAKQIYRHVPYRGAILNWDQAKIDELNKRGGLRLFSFSDYIRGSHYLEVKKLLEDAQARGLSVKAITKNPHFVEDFADTGITINVSIDMENKGYGMDWNQAAYFKRTYPNVKVRSVARDIAEVKEMLELTHDGIPNFIDVVTPYHHEDRTQPIPHGYEDMTWDAKWGKEMRAMFDANPQLNGYERTFCQVGGKCFHKEHQKQCAANCGLGSGNLSVPEFMKVTSYTPPADVEEVTARNEEVGDISFSRTPTSLGFYSQMERVLEKKLPGSGSPEQFLQAIKRWSSPPETVVNRMGELNNKQDKYKKGIGPSLTDAEVSELSELKKEAAKYESAFKNTELKWSGLEEWLQEQQGKVTKQAVLDYLGSNQVEIKEKTKKSSSEYSYQGNEWQIAIDQAEARGDFDEAERINRAWEGLDEETGSTAGMPKFSTWVLPGGKNYREMLFTLPIGKKVLDDETAQRLGAEKGWEVDDAKFQSSHWDEPNVFAHTRVNDRTNADGERVLFVEEIQSDWALEGRKRGYASDQIDPKTWLTQRGYDVSNLNENQIENEARSLGWDRQGVPPFPFSKNWEELVLKRLLRYAAENGYDRIAWISGEETAKRYDLSKKVEKISASELGEDDNPYMPGQRLVMIKLREGNNIDLNVAKDGEIVGIAQSIPELQMVKGKNLSEIIGKELTEKIINATGPVKLEGLDLKIGGKWAFNLYDKMIPTFLGKYAKKFGAKVEGTEFSSPRGDWSLVRESGTATGLLREEAERMARDRGGKAIPTEEKKSFLSLPITDSMRSSVLTEGQPLFKTTHGWDVIEPERYPLDRATVDETISRILLKWNNAPSIIVIEDYNDLPQSIRDEAVKQKASLNTIDGAHWNGKVYIFARNIDTMERLEEVLFHEAYGHYGIKGILGADANKKLTVLYGFIGGSAGIGRMLKRYNINLKHYGEGLKDRPLDVKRRIILEELLAHIAQDGKPTWKKKAKEIIGQIKLWLRKHGFNFLGDYQDTEILALLKQAREFVENGEGGADNSVNFAISNKGWGSKLTLEEAQEITNIVSDEFGVDYPVIIFDKKGYRTYAAVADPNKKIIKLNLGSQTLGSLVHELKHWAGKWHHKKDFYSDDSIAKFLKDKGIYSGKYDPLQEPSKVVQFSISQDIAKDSPGMRQAQVEIERAEKRLGLLRDIASGKLKIKDIQTSDPDLSFLKQTYQSNKKHYGEQAGRELTDQEFALEFEIPNEEKGLKKLYQVMATGTADAGPLAPSAIEMPDEPYTLRTKNPPKKLTTEFSMLPPEDQPGDMEALLQELDGEDVKPEAKAKAVKKLLKETKILRKAGFDTRDIGHVGALFDLPYWAAKSFPALKEFIYRQIQREGDRNQLIKEFLETPTKKRAGQYHEVLMLPQKDAEDLMMKAIVPSDRENRIMKKSELIDMGLNENQIIAYYAYDRTMKKAWKKITDHARDMLLRPYKDETWVDLLSDVIDGNITEEEAIQTIDDDVEAANFKYALHMTTDMRSVLKRLRSEIDKVKFYFPRVREQGEYVVRVRKGRKVVHMERTKASALGQKKEKWEAERIAKRLQERYPTGHTVEVSHEQTTSEDVYQRLNDIAMERFIATAGQKLKAREDVTAEARKATMRALLESVSDELKARAFQQHSIHRLKGSAIAGYKTENFKRIFHDYITGMAGIITKQDFAYDVYERMSQIAVGKDKVPERLFNMIQNYTEDMLRNTDVFDRISSKLRALAFGYYLAANLKSAAVQYTQNYITGIPMLAAELKDSKQNGLFKAERMYHKAMADVIRKHYTPEEKRMIDILHDRGYTEEQFVKEMRGRLGNKWESGLSRVIYLASVPFAGMEVFNRRSAGLARFRAARAAGMSFDVALSKAEDFIYDTHYLMGKANLPAVASGKSVASKAIRTGLTFRTFNLNYMRSLFNAMRKSENGRRHFGYIARSLAYTALAGGLLSWPWLDDILEMIEQKLGYPARSKVSAGLKNLGGEKLERFFAAGLPGLVGVDISGSLKMGLPWPIGSGSVSDVTGVYSGIYNKISNSMRAMDNGDYLRALEHASPMAFENMLKGIRMGTRGDTTIREKGKFDVEGELIKLSPAEMVAQMVGFRSANVASEGRSRRVYKNIETYFKKKRDSIYENLRSADARGDDDAVDKIYDAIDKYNDKADPYAGAIPFIDQDSIIRAMKDQPSTKQMLFQESLEN